MFSYVCVCVCVCVCVYVTLHRFSDSGADERERQDHERPPGLSVPEERRRATVFSLFQTSHHLHPRLRGKTAHYQGTAD